MVSRFCNESAHSVSLNPRVSMSVSCKANGMLDSFTGFSSTPDMRHAVEKCVYVWGGGGGGGGG